MLPCCHVTMLPYCHVAILLCCHVAMLPYCHIAILPCYHVTMLPCYHVAMLPCCHVTMLPCCHVVILPFLHAAEWDSWHHLVIRDESCFFFKTSSRCPWLLSRNNVLKKPRLDIQSKKFMLTIIWNPSSFHVVDRLPNDIKINSAYFVTNVLILLIPLEQVIFPRGRAPHEKRLVISIDNCPVHTSRNSTD
jgi:hypothetical protein